MAQQKFQADAFQASAFDANDPVADTTPSLGGVMTILLLAQRGTRRERTMIYGKKHRMR